MTDVHQLEAEQAEIARQEALRQQQLEQRLAQARPAGDEAVRALASGSRSDQDAMRSQIESSGGTLAHKTLDAHFRDWENAHQAHMLGDKRGDGTGKAIPDMSQHNVEGIAGEQASRQSLEAQYPGRLIVPREPWVLKDFGQEPAEGHAKLNPDKLITSEEYAGQSEELLKAAVQNGNVVFDQVIDDKAYRFSGLDAKTDHVLLHEDFGGRLDRVRAGALEPSAVANTGELVDVALKYENFPGLAADGKVVLNVPRDMHSRTCYLENGEVHNRIEDYVRREAGARGFKHPERIEVRPLDKTTRELGELAQVGRTGLDLSPGEAQAAAGKIDGLLQRYQQTRDPEALRAAERQIIEPNIRSNLGAGDDGVFVVDSTGHAHRLYQPEALPPEARDHLSRLLADTRQAEVSMEGVPKGTGYVSFPEAHSAAQELHGLIEPAAVANRPATDAELGKMSSVLKRSGLELQRDAQGFYVNDSDGFAHRVWDCPEHQPFPPFQRQYVKAM